MDDQSIINWAMAAVGALGGWWMKAMWESLKELQLQDRALADKVAAIEILVAGTYVKRDDIDKMVDALFRKLDKIHDKLDTKMDKE